MTSLPEIFLSEAEAHRVAELGKPFEDLAALEAAAVEDDALRTRVVDALSSARESFLRQWRARDHVVLRNVPPSTDGSTGLLLAISLFSALKAYRGRQIVRHFRMSPWTTALSHTAASGFFHTDINTADVPPAATLMQCLHPDPGAPAYGLLRVAAIADLLEELHASGAASARRLLEADHVTMVNETSPDGWRGLLVSDATVRFHPESLRAAQRRWGSNPPDLEECLRVIHEAALAVSIPIHLDRGEMLIVSNRRALHQRGACTVQFHSYPRDFAARKVAVLHTMDEPA